MAKKLNFDKSVKSMICLNQANCVQWQLSPADCV